MNLTRSSVNKLPQRHLRIVPLTPREILARKNITSYDAAAANPGDCSTVDLVIVREGWPVPLRCHKVTINAGEVMRLEDYGYIPEVTLIADGCVFMAKLYTAGTYVDRLQRRGQQNALLNIIENSEDDFLFQLALAAAARLEMRIPSAYLEKIYNTSSGPYSSTIRRAVVELMGKSRENKTFMHRCFRENRGARLSIVINLIKLGCLDGLEENIMALNESERKTCLETLANSQAGNQKALKILMRFFTVRSGDLALEALRLAAEYFGIEGKRAVVIFFAEHKKPRYQKWAEFIYYCIPRPKTRLYLTWSEGATEFTQWKTVLAEDAKKETPSLLTQLFLSVPARL